MPSSTHRAGACALAEKLGTTEAKLERVCKQMFPVSVARTSAALCVFCMSLHSRLIHDHLFRLNPPFRSLGRSFSDKLIMKQKRVLLVDDDVTLWLLMADSRARLCLDFEIEAVASGEKALRRMEKGTVDLIVSDYRMPIIVSLELIKTSRTKTPNMLWLWTTPYNAEEVKKCG